MPYCLKERATYLRELADDPDCDRTTLYNTYIQFKTLNLISSRWQSIYEVYIRPWLQIEERTLTLLDVGCGGGDIALAIAEWVAQDNLSLKITAIDTDIRAINFTNSQSNPHHVEFLNVSTSQLVAQNRSFDFVISNHFLHHLNSNELKDILIESEHLATKMVLFNDIERSALLYYYYAALGLVLEPFFPQSFIWVDGCRSIRRGYTRSELLTIANDHWQVKRLFFSRLLLIYTP
ncbi:methyltransferase domain-containing protein [Pleurocapsales cyanobacterium LEGE 10410]|nr:methyltransferase domain-containing protein [Pleurocapsales cyanobacterium LEGE 10410]